MQEFISNKYLSYQLQCQHEYESDLAKIMQRYVAGHGARVSE